MMGYRWIDRHDGLKLHPFQDCDMGGRVAGQRQRPATLVAFPIPFLDREEMA